MTGEGTPHRGILYRGRADLLDVVVPLVLGRLARGHHVTVVLDDLQARAVRDGLGVADDHRAISYVAPDSAPRHDSPALVGWIRRAGPPPAPVLVLGRLGRGDTSGSAGLDPALARAAATLVCLCPLGDDPDRLADFRRHHRVHVNTERDRAPARTASTGVGAGAFVESRIDHVDDLRGLRVHVDDLAAASGFSRSGRRRAVLAVHEAATLACRLSEGTAPDRAAERATDRCTVRVRARLHVLVAEIDLPRASTFPAELADHDPLQYVRAFAADAGWSGTLRTRRLRVAVRESSAG